MKKIKLLLLLFGLASVAFGFPTSLNTPTEPNGEELYYTHCKSCHMKKGQGFFRLYPPLTDTNWVGNDSLIVGNILNGISGPIVVNDKTYDREMPPVTGLSDGEIAAIINYIRTEIAAIDKPISEQKVALIRGS